VQGNVSYQCSVTYHFGHSINLCFNFGSHNKASVIFVHSVNGMITKQMLCGFELYISRVKCKRKPAPVTRHVLSHFNSSRKTL